MSLKKSFPLKSKLFTIIPSSLKKKRNRNKGIIWSLEEEYMLFETHLVLGNKWKEYPDFFPLK